MLRDGEVEEGDAIEFSEQQKNGVTITDIVNLYSADSQNQELLHRATELSALPQSWKIIPETPWMPTREFVIRNASHFCGLKVTEDLLKFATERVLTNEAAIESGMEQKRKEFLEQGAEVYAKT